MTVNIQNKVIAAKRLKTIQVTDDFERNLRVLRSFYTTDAKAIRDAVKLLAMERMGEVVVTLKNQ